jgi:hypothetical protein
MPSKDDLLDEPLLSPDELKSYVTDLKALQQGKITGVVGSQILGARDYGNGAAAGERTNKRGQLAKACHVGAGDLQCPARSCHLVTPCAPSVE